MIQQIAVFLENKEGRAGDCCKVLKDANVNLYSLSIADTKEFGILRVIADDNEKALAALKGAGFLSTIVDLIGVEVPQKAGALADILIALENGGVNVEYMYSFAGTDNHAQIAFKTGTPEKAIAALKAVGATVL
jgi:hypothetical protein